MEPVLRLVSDNLLDKIKEAILAGHQRLDKGHAEWVEGSLQIALALREGRELVPAHIGFSEWLKTNQLDFFDKNDRVCLISLASNPELAREVLTAATSRNYRFIWRTARTRYPMQGKTTTKMQTPKRTRRSNSVKQAFRIAKLGVDTMRRIDGTSLDRSDELDELIMLNRGALPGELTDDVRQLVDDAAAGKHVSAVAFGRQASGRRPPTIGQLKDAFRRRMTFIWEQTDNKTREAFIEYLMEDLKGNDHHERRPDH